MGLHESLEQFERQVLTEAMRRAEGNELEAAILLHLDIDDLLVRLKRHGIRSDRRAA